MKAAYKSIITSIVCIFIFATGICFSQTINLSVINSCGGNVKNGYYQFEWSVGEMALVDEMSTTNNLIVTNGFLQPYILNPGNDNISSDFGKDEIKVFPSPASSYVEINFFTKQKGLIKIEMLNALGQKIYLKEINGYGVDLIHRISVNQLMSGAYLIYITLDPEAGSVSKRGVYKIIKG